MKSKNVILVSPTPECVCLAASCRRHWNDLYVSGRKTIESVFESWIQSQEIKEAIVLLPDVLYPQKVRKQLSKLDKQGILIQWFAPKTSHSVQKTCIGIKNVTLIKDENIKSAFSKIFTVKQKSIEFNNPVLNEYLRYKITLSLLRSLNPEPIMEAINNLKKAAGSTFTKKNIPAKDVDSLERFKDAEFPYIEGESQPIMQLKSRILQIAPTDMSVLIIGETGTGKKAVAFYLHELSNRRSKPLVSINCAGLDENVLCSELFGHVRGSFTGAIQDRVGLVEQANQGTLFLDELGEMPLTVQAELLRFIQTKQFRRLGENKERKTDIRIIAAAQSTIKEKRFVLRICA